MKNDNKGFSLIEMIIIIAILSIIAGVSFSGVNYIIFANSKKCATQVNSMLDKARLDNMSKTGNSTLYIYRFNDCNYVKFTDESSPVLNATGTKISGSQIKIYYTTSEGSALPKEIDKCNPAASEGIMKIQFNKSSGGLQLIPGRADYYKKILFKKGSGDTDYTISLIAVTGKHILK